MINDLSKMINDLKCSETAKLQLLTTDFATFDQCELGDAIGSKPCHRQRGSGRISIPL